MLMSQQLLRCLFGPVKAISSTTNHPLEIYRNSSLFLCSYSEDKPLHYINEAKSRWFETSRWISFLRTNLMIFNLLHSPTIKTALLAKKIFDHFKNMNLLFVSALVFEIWYTYQITKNQKNNYWPVLKV